jgi:hypothetical protein
MARWSFHLQVFFLARRFEMHRKMMDNMLSVRSGPDDLRGRRDLRAHAARARRLWTSATYSNYQSLFALHDVLSAAAGHDHLPAGACRDARAAHRPARPRLRAQHRPCLSAGAERGLRRLGGSQRTPDLRFLVVDTDGLDRIETHPAIVKLVSELQPAAARAGRAGAGEAGA